MALLEIRNLTVEFVTRRGVFRAVDGVDMSLDEGGVLGIVGESGSGKSVSMLAIMGLIGYPGRVTADRLSFGGHDLLTLDARARRKIIGKDMAMIFQEPMSSLNPCLTVGFQIMETLQVHEGGDRAQRKARTIELLGQVGIPAPVTRLRAFPYPLSGGMSQRVMIVMAIARPAARWSSTARMRRPSASRLVPSCGARCRWCSRIPTGPSIRARPWARLSKSRW